MEKIIKAKLLIRRDTGLNWTQNNPILYCGEIGYDITKKRHKIGDGVRRWLDLPYFALQTDLDDRVIFISRTKDQWQYWGRQQSQRGVFYIYTDNEVIQDQQGNDIYVPGIKLGDGLAYICDLPFITDYLSKVLFDHINNRIVHITQQEREFWNNKVTSYINKNDVNNLVLDKGALLLE